MGRIPAVAHISSEFRNNDPVINPKAIYLAVSQSGETADTISAIKEIKLKGGQVYGVVNVVGSTIARLCGRGVYIHSGPEQSVASTKAFTNMVAALTIFATQLGRTRHLSKDDGRDLIQHLQQAPHLMETYFRGYRTHSRCGRPSARGPFRVVPRSWPLCHGRQGGGPQTHGVGLHSLFGLPCWVR